MSQATNDNEAKKAMFEAARAFEREADETVEAEYVSHDVMRAFGTSVFVRIGPNEDTDASKLYEVAERHDVELEFYGGPFEYQAHFHEGDF